MVVTHGGSMVLTHEGRGRFGRMVVTHGGCMVVTQGVAWFPCMGKHGCDTWGKHMQV